LFAHEAAGAHGAQPDAAGIAGAVVPHVRAAGRAVLTGAERDRRGRFYDTVPAYFMSVYYTDVCGFYKSRGNYLKPLPKLLLQDDFNHRMNGVDRFDAL
jgi:hypothetical protein